MKISYLKSNGKLFWGILIACILINSFFACEVEQKIITEKKQIELDKRYANINNIIAIADCLSPQGNYVTKVISNPDGSCFFFQEYDYRVTPFSCKLTADNEGYILDSANIVIDTLSDQVIEMIRSHEFHKLHSQPGHFFHNIQFRKNIDNSLQLFNAMDRLDHPTNLYYDKKERLVKKVELKNPIDTSEQIEIVNKEWIESDYGSLVKTIEIIQAGRDTFHFNYNHIDINGSLILNDESH